MNILIVSGVIVYYLPNASKCHWQVHHQSWFDQGLQTNMLLESLQDMR